LKKVDELLAEGRKRFTPLQRLLDQAANQEAWSRELWAVLPEYLRGTCQVTAIRGSSLHVTCADGAVATRLRFLASEVIKKLRVLSHYRAIQKIEISISREGN